MATPAIVSIETIVTSFLLKYELPLERAVPYTEHALDCVRDFHLYDSPNVVTEKIAVSALGIVELPSDMIGFNGLFINLDNELWPFTKKDTIVNTTTFTLGVEGQDSHFGEGGAINDPNTDTYGGVGGVNDYYYTIDWKARRIFCEGIKSDTVFLRYTTSGIELTGATNVPDFIRPLVDDYLLWKKSIMDGDGRSEQVRARAYDKSEMKIRNLINSMTYDEWHDLLLSITTQAPLR